MDLSIPFLFTKILFADKVFLCNEKIGKMFILIYCHEREINLIGKYGTIGRARYVMFNDIIGIMKNTNQDVNWIDDVKKRVKLKEYDDSFTYQTDEMGINADNAWANFNNGNHDWQIIKI